MKKVMDKKGHHRCPFFVFYRPNAGALWSTGSIKLGAARQSFSINLPSLPPENSKL